MDKWIANAYKLEGLSPSDKTASCLSKETLEGLRMTGIIAIIYSYNWKVTNLLLLHVYVVHSFVELTKYLLALPGVRYVLSEKFCQDPLESFFGKQRMRGGYNDNPNVQMFLKNTISLRIQGSLASNPETIQTGVIL